MCGFRDDDGIVKSLEHFKTIEIPREVDVSKLATYITRVHNILCTLDITIVEIH